MAFKVDILHPAIERYLVGMLPDREPWFLEMEKMAEEGSEVKRLKAGPKDASSLNTQH